MPAMTIDVQCPQCYGKFGWAGSYSNRPACPRCGHRPPQEKLDEIDRRIEADEERRRTDPMVASGETIRQQRLDAGLTLRQAAKIMRIIPSWLSDVEQGRQPCPEALAERMRETYGLEKPATRRPLTPEENP